MHTQTKQEKALHIVLRALMLCGVVVSYFSGVAGIGQVVFFLSFILAIVIFVGYLFNWVILGIHGPGWFHPLDYLKGSWELRTLLIGMGCLALVWWQFH